MSHHQFRSTTKAKVQNLQKEVSGCSTLIKELSAKVREQDEELSAVKKGVLPTYGELIAMLEDAEIEAKCSEMSAPDLLETKFYSKYPHILISRPGRLFDSISRIAAPTRSSAIGPRKLDGSPLQSYLERTWLPRTRNIQGTAIILGPFGYHG